VIENPVSTVNEISLKVAGLPAGINFVRVICQGKMQTSGVMINR